MKETAGSVIFPYDIQPDKGFINHPHAKTKTFYNGNFEDVHRNKRYGVRPLLVDILCFFISSQRIKSKRRELQQR